MSEPIWGLSFVINLILILIIIRNKDYNTENIALAFLFGVFTGGFLLLLTNIISFKVLQFIVIHLIVALVYLKILKS
jgi:hypothetical protein